MSNDPLDSIFGPDNSFKPPRGFEVTEGPLAPRNQAIYQRRSSTKSPYDEDFIQPDPAPFSPPQMAPEKKAAWAPLPLDDEPVVATPEPVKTAGAGIGGPERVKLPEPIKPTEQYQAPNTDPPPAAPPKAPPKQTGGAALIAERLMKAKALAAEQAQLVADGRRETVPMNSDQVGGGRPEDAKPSPNAGPSDVGPMKLAHILRSCGVPDSLCKPNSMIVMGIQERAGSLQKTAAAISGDEDAAQRASLFRSDDVHPLALQMTMSMLYGSQWVDWEPETVHETILADTGVALSDVVANKIAACKVILRQDELVQSDWHIFEKVCVALNGSVPRMTVIEDLDPEQMVFGVLCVSGLMHGSNFRPSPELQRYMACRLFDAGFIVAPPAIGYVDNDLKAIKPEAVDEELRKKVLMRYAEVLGGGTGAPADGEPEAINIQVGRLLRCNAYAIDKSDDLIRQLE